MTERSRICVFTIKSSIMEGETPTPIMLVYRNLKYSTHVGMMFMHRPCCNAEVWVFTKPEHLHLTQNICHTTFMEILNMMQHTTRLLVTQPT
jgi:hypothetical protein